MEKNKLKLKFDFGKTLLFAYRWRFVIFTALFVILLLNVFNVCHDKIYPENEVAENFSENNYIGIEKSKLERVVEKIKDKESNITENITKEYQDPFDIVKMDESDTFSDDGFDTEALPMAR